VGLLKSMRYSHFLRHLNQTKTNKMFRKLALVAAFATLFYVEATNHHNKVDTPGHKGRLIFLFVPHLTTFKARMNERIRSPFFAHTVITHILNTSPLPPVKSVKQSKRVKKFSICLYIPGGGFRRLEEEGRDLGEVSAAGVGFGYFNGIGYGYNLNMDYLSAIMYECDTEVELGTYGVFCRGDSNSYYGGGYYGYGGYPGGQAVQSDCEHNFAFAGEPGSALVIHTSTGTYGTSVTTLGGSGKFFKSEVVNLEAFDEVEGEFGFTFEYKTRGYNPLNAKDVQGLKKAPKSNTTKL